MVVLEVKKSKEEKFSCSIYMKSFWNLRLLKIIIIFFSILITHWESQEYVTLKQLKEKYLSARDITALLWHEWFLLLRDPSKFQCLSPVVKNYSQTSFSGLSHKYTVQCCGALQADVRPTSKHWQPTCWKANRTLFRQRRVFVSVWNNISYSLIWMQYGVKVQWTDQWKYVNKCL